MEIDVIEDTSNDTEDKKAIDIILRILKNASTEKKLKAAEILKRLFNKTSTATLENRIYHRMTIEDLLQNLEGNQKGFGKYQGKDDFLLKYSNCILNYINSTDEMNTRLLTQLEWIYNQLSQSDKSLKIFIRDVWNRLGSKSTDCLPLFNLILPSSSFYIEEIIFKVVKQIFLGEESDVNMKHFVRLSGHLPALFKTITLIFDRFLVITHYNDEIINIVNYFVKDLFRYCNESGLNVLSLYRRDCCRLVSLLRMPVEVLDVGTKNNVCEVLWENFKSDRGRVLMLLSHFPIWFDVFVEFVEKK